MCTLTEDVVLSRSRATSLGNVKKLNCWGSGLSDISILRKMPNVEVVTLSVNEISSLEDFAYCPKLKELYLRRNVVTDLDEIHFLKDLPCLKVLWLSDNPCSEVQDYRSTIIKNLPNIEKLDNIEVCSEELDDVLSDKNDLAEASCNDVNDHEVDDLTSTENNGTHEMYNGEYSAQELLDQTNKLRTQLGLQPLVIEESTEDVQNSIPNLAEKRPVSCNDTGLNSSTKNSNLLSAVLLLLNDMSEDELHLVQKEVDQKLETIRETSNDLERSEVFTT
ncbi:C21orf2-like isoform X2 [Paramuricea clavata]|uniref:C21orf2-like isoform X2 n=1 Tax=Paramuricea clavata TaxID=317549 RepID=A0A7D9HDV1_PARCT|nr:C21orf2-like isoform X2 [Paramuricea clavata]